MMIYDGYSGAINLTNYEQIAYNICCKIFRENCIITPYLNEVNDDFIKLAAYSLYTETKNNNSDQNYNICSEILYGLSVDHQQNPYRPEFYA